MQDLLSIDEDLLHPHWHAVAHFSGVQLNVKFLVVNLLGIMVMSCFFRHTPLSTCGAGEHVPVTTARASDSISQFAHLAQDDSAHVPVLVVDRHAKRHFKVARRLLDRIQQLDEGWAIVKRAHSSGNAILEVNAAKTRNRDENDIVAAYSPSRHFKEWRQLGDAFIVPERTVGYKLSHKSVAGRGLDAPLFFPVHCRVIHFVDGDYERSNTCGLGQHSVLAGLSSLFEASLELSFARADNKHGDVGLAGTADHVRYKVLVAGGI